MVSQGSSGKRRSDNALPPAYRAAVRTFRPLVKAVTRQDWQGADNLPDSGCVICVNHISHGDPLAVAHFLYDNGHPAFFLAKASLFEMPVVGRWIKACEQVPVYRGEGRAIEAFRDAVSAVRAGRCVVIMPESTITKDPLGWPMTGKTGAARIAFETGAPVLPLAQWGAQQVRRPFSRPRPFSRAVMQLRLGPAVDLSDLRARRLDGAVLREATTRIMADITRGVEHLRGEPAPDGVFDPRLRRRVDPGAHGGTGGARRGEATGSQEQEETRGA